MFSLEPSLVSTAMSLAVISARFSLIIALRRTLGDSGASGGMDAVLARPRPFVDVGSLVVPSGGMTAVLAETRLFLDVGALVVPFGFFIASTGAH
jgi:hypothetical protein